MKCSPIRKVSNKQKKELALRSKLKKEYMEETEGHYMTYGSTGDIRGLSLSHIVALSRGGKSTKENTLLECYLDHTRYEKKPELREQEHPELFEKWEDDKKETAYLILGICPECPIYREGTDEEKDE